MASPARPGHGDAAFGAVTLGVDLDGPSLVRVGGMVIVVGTESPDHVLVTTNAANGWVVVNVGTRRESGRIVYEQFILSPTRPGTW
jgi:hypothetical protein